MRITTLVMLTLVAFGAQAAGKTAFINSKVLLEQSPQAIEANTLLKEQFGGREQDLRELAREIQEMEQNYQRDAAIMSTEQQQKAEDKILQAKRRFQRDQQSLREAERADDDSCSDPRLRRGQRLRLHIYRCEHRLRQRLGKHHRRNTRDSEAVAAAPG